MASTVTLVGNASLSGTEQVDSTTSPASTSGGNTRRFTAYNVENVSLTSTSTPNVDSPPADLSKTLSSSSETISLTAAPLARDVAKTQDLTGKKLVAILLSAPVGNSNPITIAPAASNGYNLFGASGQVTLQPGEAIVKLYESGATNNSPSVSGTAKDITISGTTGDEVEIIAYFGT